MSLALSWVITSSKLSLLLIARLTGSATGSLASSSAFWKRLQSINRAFSNTEGPIYRGIFHSKSASLGQLLVRDYLWTRFSVHQQGRLHYKWDDTVRNLSFQVDFCLQKWNKMNKFLPDFGRPRTPGKFPIVSNKMQIICIHFASTFDGGCMHASSHLHSIQVE